MSVILVVSFMLVLCFDFDPFHIQLSVDRWWICKACVRVCVCVCVLCMLLQSPTEVATARHKVWYEYWMCKAFSLYVKNSLLMAFWDAQGIMVLLFMDHWPTIITYGHCTALWHLTNVIWMKKTPSPNFFSTGIQIVMWRK